MPMCGNSGCAIANWRARSTSSPSTSCRTGRTSRSRRAAAADHVDAIRKQVVERFPGKEIVIGEVGWPSAGRMREGALPSPANQARVIADVLARGKQEHFRVNVIEAFDQPWKRALEGTVGGHWGLFDDGTRQQKFVWGEPVSNHPHWPWQAAGGVVACRLGVRGARRRAPVRGCAVPRSARSVACDRAERRGGRRSGRVDHREPADRKSRHRRLAARAVVRGACDCGADGRALRRWRRATRAAGVCEDHRPPSRIACATRWR